MHCFWCRIESGNLTLKEHEAARWLNEDELESVDWLPADKEILVEIIHNSK
jgi:8-oxo-dGTP diphosphatase